MNTFNAILVAVSDAEQTKFGYRLRMVDSVSQSNTKNTSRFLDVNAGDKTPEWIRETIASAKKGERFSVEGSLMQREYEGKNYDELKYVTRIFKLAPRDAGATSRGNNAASQGPKPGQLDEIF